MKQVLTAAASSSRASTRPATVIVTEPEARSLSLSVLNSHPKKGGFGTIMSLRNRVLKAIAAAVDEVNQQQPADQTVSFSETAQLVGAEAALDSVGLVTLVVAVEQQVEEELGTLVSLTTESVMTRWEEVFASVGSLADHLTAELGDVDHGR